MLENEDIVIQLHGTYKYKMTFVNSIVSLFMRRHLI